MSNAMQSNALVIALQKQGLNPSLSPDVELGRGAPGLVPGHTPPPLMMHPTRLAARGAGGEVRAPLQTPVALTGVAGGRFGLTAFDCQGKTGVCAHGVGGRVA